VDAATVAGFPRLSLDSVRTQLLLGALTQDAMRRFRIWRLKRALRRAAVLHTGGMLSNAQYGAYAVYAVERLRREGAPLRLKDLRGKDCGWISFPIEAGVALKRQGERWPAIDFSAGLSVYGPFNHATIWVQEAIEKLPGFQRRESSFVWDVNAEELLKDARFKLSTWNRVALTVEEWIAERQLRLPNVAGTVARALVIIATAILSFFVGRFSK
jgi:hypothetical protein